MASQQERAELDAKARQGESVVSSWWDWRAEPRGPRASG